MATSSTLPSTPNAAPPNFYSMQAGGNSGSSDAGGDAQAKPQKSDDQKFLEAVTKLLSVLTQMGDMAPRGKDVKKYTDAAAKVMNDCLEDVFGKGAGKSATANTPGSDSGTAQTATEEPSAASMSAGAGAGSGMGSMA